jgi:hypothetical protein
MNADSTVADAVAACYAFVPFGELEVAGLTQCSRRIRKRGGALLRSAGRGTQSAVTWC